MYNASEVDRFLVTQIVQKSSTDMFCNYIATDLKPGLKGTISPKVQITVFIGVFSVFPNTCKEHSEILLSSSHWLQLMSICNA